MPPTPPTPLIPPNSLQDAQPAGPQISPVAAACLREARAVAVLTGAGISAESGIATFRDALSGLWQNFQIDDLATPQGFLRDPALVWGWYEARRRQVLTAQPNPGHLALAQLARKLPKLTLITQNVDDLHERAGSEPVLHLHGSLFEPRCFDCATPWQADPVAQAAEGAALAAAESADERCEPPACPACGGKVRPGVVWFGENLPEAIWQQAQTAVEECDLLLILGTSGVVYPAAGLAQFAHQNGKTVIQINPHPTTQDCYAHHVLTGPAGVVLPALLALAWPEPAAQDIKSRSEADVHA